MDPTKQRFLDNLNWIVTESNTGDIIALSYSDHVAYHLVPIINTIRMLKVCDVIHDSYSRNIQSLGSKAFHTIT